jgi:membrane fusion protein (multidrug efflux system)
MSKKMIQMLAVVLIVVATLGFVKFRQIQAGMAAGKAFQMPPEAVTTVVCQPARWESTVQAVGNVAPVQGVTLSADQPGVVAKVNFQSGSHVKAGQVLVQLDTRQEHAQLESAAARRDLAKSTLDRSKKLVDDGAISQAEFDQANAQYKDAEATVGVIQATIDRKTIRAPFAGTAGIRRVNVGQYLNSGDPVVPLQALDRMFVDFTVPQEQVSALRAGAVVQIADSGAVALATGKVTAINPVADEATRNVQVQATFENSKGRLRPGMYVTVLILTGREHPVFAVPASAINYAPYGNSVFIVEQIKGPDGKAYKGVRQQFVQLGEGRGDQVAVLTGITPGQEVVTSGVFKLRTGAAVVVNNTVKPSNEAAPKPEDS